MCIEMRRILTEEWHRVNKNLKRKLPDFEMTQWKVYCETCDCVLMIGNYKRFTK
jgi:hypothetical protein